VAGRRLGLRGDRGSIPMALLVVIVMGGLLTVLLSRTVMEQRSTQRDNEFTTALHAAEIGFDDAVFRLNNHLVVGDDDEGAGEVDGYAYEWGVERAGAAWRAWSTGTGPNGVARTISADVTDRPIFDLALATHLGVNFSGGNTADSYNSATGANGTTCSMGASPSTGCFGIIASNGVIHMGSASGVPNYADRVQVYDWGNPTNTGAGRCTHANNTYCQEPFRRNYEDPLDIRGRVGFAEDLAAACTAAGAWTSWKATDVAPGNGAGQNRWATMPSTPDVTLGDGTPVFCFSELTLDTNIEMPSGFDDYVVSVRDRLYVGGQLEVNCPSCKSNAAFGSAAKPFPRARNLQIFTMAEDTCAGNANCYAVRILQQTHFAGTIYAPDATCGSQTGGTHIYGSLICNFVTNAGNWSFHYDEDLMDGLSTNEYFVSRWTEE
jgi:type II secretory pathway pseudopilin PulG